jgi:hypothetical protein
MDQISRNLLVVEEARWRLSGALDSGGTSEEGETQYRRADGGGRWVCESEIILTTENEVRLYETLLLRWSLGFDIAIVSRIGGPLLLGFVEGGSTALVPFSDGSTFSDGSMFLSGGAGGAILVDAVTKGSTSYRVRVEGAPRALMGGEPFTMTGPVYQERLHGNAGILSQVADGGGIIYTILAAPPLREDYPAGTLVDFDNPRVVMRPDINNPDVWPSYRSVFRGARIPVSWTETRRMT